MANPIKFDSIRRSKLSNKCEDEPSFEKNEHKYVLIRQIPRTSGGSTSKSYLKELFRLSTQLSD